MSVQLAVPEPLPQLELLVGGQCIVESEANAPGAVESYGFVGIE